MVELPRGTVTFLFTDIEGSTQLLKRLGDGYATVLAEHQRILRHAAAASEGREVDTQGDSFFFAFARANAALGAAVAAQRALAEHEWPEGGEVRVRMGLHTGEPAVGDERYVGLGVHRAARIGAVGHGGQVLLSSATRELVEDEVGGVSVRELGSYRLKDIDRPERLFQLDIDGLRTDFPPLKAEKVAEPHPRRRRGILLAALAGVIGAAVAIPIFAFGQGGGGGSIEAAAGDSVGFVDPDSGRLDGDVDVGAGPTRVAVGEGAIWVADTDGQSVSRIDPDTKAVVDTIPVGSGPSGITTGNGSVWVANSLDGTVSRIDPGTNGVVQKIDVGNDPLGIASAAGSIWVANTADDTVTRIDPATGKPGKPLSVAATELAFGAGTLWASQRSANHVARIDPKTGDVVASIPVGNGPSGIAFGDGAAWVANTLDGTVTRIDPATNAQAAVIPVGNGPTAVAVDSRGVWVSNQFGGTLLLIDPRTNRVVRRIAVGNRPQGVTLADGDVLVAVRASGAGHRGGTLTLRQDRSPSSSLDSIDTAVAYTPTSWMFLRIVGDGLVAYDQVGGLAGAQLVPDLAVSLPTPTDGGRTYTFRLRPGIRYSTGRAVKASDFRATFERAYEIGLPVAYFDGIVGAARCASRPKRCDLSRGIVANDTAKTVTFHLVAPDPDFLYKLAAPFAHVVPAGTPAKQVGTDPLPATGPYLIADYRPNELLRLVRNPHFHEWSQAAQPDGYPDEIVFRIRGTIDETIADVVGGKADVLALSQPISSDRLNAIMTQHASQVHTNPLPSIWALFLNTRVPPFNRLDVRRALNYAADRAAAVRAAGGPNNARATCQILPPNFPGYRPYCSFTVGSTSHGTWTAPDLTKARALVARSGTRGMNVEVLTWTQARTFGRFAVQLLHSLGYRTSVKLLGNDYFASIADPRKRAAVGWFGWSPDWPAPSGFFPANFSCGAFVPENPPASTNVAEFCAPGIDREMQRATREQATNPEAARRLWARIDGQIVDRAPWVPLVNTTNIDVLSKRVGNYQYSPAGPGLLLDQLWVRS